MACTSVKPRLASLRSIALIYWLLGISTAPGVSLSDIHPAKTPDRLVGFPSLAHAFFTLWTGEQERAEADWAISENFQDEWHHLAPVRRIDEGPGRPRRMLRP